MGPEKRQPAQARARPCKDRGREKGRYAWKRSCRTRLPFTSGKGLVKFGGLREGRFAYFAGRGQSGAVGRAFRTSARQRLCGGRGFRWRFRRCGDCSGKFRPRHSRSQPAGNGWHRGAALHALASGQGGGADTDGARHAGRKGQGARSRRRRLHDQALRHHRI
ncbi:hypothetical protein D3C71_1703210 [compost metagenome]